MGSSERRATLELIRKYEDFNFNPSANVYVESAEVEPMPVFGPGVHVAIVGSLIVGAMMWWGIFAVAHLIYTAVTR